jgi:hypothetical protein
MTTISGPTKFFITLCSPARWRMRSLQVTAVALLLSLTFGVAPSHAVPSSSANGAHVYMLRGILNIFSLGLDNIATKLESQGIPVTVINYIGWSGLADEIAADYRSGKVKTIIVVGHSSGATYLPDLVERLDKLGAPVKLAIGLDSVFRTRLSGRVGRYVNYYIGNGNGEPVARTKELKGSLENVNVQNVPGVGHVTIEKNEVIQRRVIGDIDAVVFGGRPKQASAAPAQ